jgi:hypothetical protein
LPFETKAETADDTHPSRPTSAKPVDTAADTQLEKAESQNMNQAKDNSRPVSASSSSPTAFQGEKVRSSRPVSAKSVASGSDGLVEASDRDGLSKIIDTQSNDQNDGNIADDETSRPTSARESCSVEQGAGSKQIISRPASSSPKEVGSEDHSRPFSDGIAENPVEQPTGDSNVVETTVNVNATTEGTLNSAEETIQTLSREAVQSLKEEAVQSLKEEAVQSLEEEAVQSLKEEAVHSLKEQDNNVYQEDNYPREEEHFESAIPELKNERVPLNLQSRPSLDRDPMDSSRPDTPTSDGGIEDSKTPVVVNQAELEKDYYSVVFGAYSDTPPAAAEAEATRFVFPGAAGGEAEVTTADKGCAGAENNEGMFLGCAEGQGGNQNDRAVVVEVEAADENVGDRGSAPGAAAEEVAAGLLS